MGAARPVRPVDFLAPVITPAAASTSSAPTADDALDALKGAHSTRCADCRTLFPRDGVNTVCRSCRNQLPLLGDTLGDPA